MKTKFDKLVEAVLKGEDELPAKRETQAEMLSNVASGVGNDLQDTGHKVKVHQRIKYFHVIEVDDRTFVMGLQDYGALITVRDLESDESKSFRTSSVVAFDISKWFKSIL